MPASAIQVLIQATRFNVADEAAECGLLVIKKRGIQDVGRKGPVRAQYSRKQLAGQTKLPFREGREKDWREPTTGFFRGREREKETRVEVKETDELEMEANSAVRIRVAKANKVTSLTESCTRSRDRSFPRLAKKSRTTAGSHVES